MKKRIWAILDTVLTHCAAGVAGVILFYIFNCAVHWNWALQEPWECSLCRAAETGELTLVNRCSGACRPMPRPQIFTFESYHEFPTPWQLNLHFCEDHIQTMKALQYPENMLVEGDTVCAVTGGACYSLGEHGVAVSGGNGTYTILVA